MIPQPPANLSAGNDFPPNPNQRNIAMWCHLSALIATMFTGFLGFVGPLIILSLHSKQPDSWFVTFHAKQSLNHQLTFMLIYVVGSILILFASAFCCAGLLLFIPLIALAVLSLVFESIAASQAINGQCKRFPLSIPFVS